MQDELLAIIEEAVLEEGDSSPREFLEDIRQLGLRTPRGAATIIRADRDRR